MNNVSRGNWGWVSPESTALQNFQNDRTTLSAVPCADILAIENHLKVLIPGAVFDQTNPSALVRLSVIERVLRELVEDEAKKRARRAEPAKEKRAPNFAAGDRWRTVSR